MKVTMTGRRIQSFLFWHEFRCGFRWGRFLKTPFTLVDIASRYIKSVRHRNVNNKSTYIYSILTVGLQNLSFFVVK